MTDHRDLIQRLRDRVFLAEDAEDEQERASFAREIVDLGRELAAANGGGLSSDESGFPPASRALRTAALHGPAGELVRTVDPHTEADPAATLIQFLLAFGNACGRGPGFRVESDYHATNEFVAIVGDTSKARKGSSWGHVRRTMRLADVEWEEGCIASGIASGEGLIHAVRDPLVIRRKARTKEERDRADEDGRIEDEVDPGIEEKRLLVIQGELAQVLRVMQREGNTVSPILRDLWDHGNARGMSKNQPEETTGSLVSLIGHITVRELRKELNEIRRATASVIADCGSLRDVPSGFRAAASSTTTRSSRWRARSRWRFGSPGPRACSGWPRTLGRHGRRSMRT